MRKLNVVLTLGVLGFSILLSGCGVGTSNSTVSQASSKPDDATKSAVTTKPAEHVNLVFWDENAGPDRTPYLQEIIKRFQTKNPNISVEYVGIPFSSAKQKYDVAIASNDTPDIGGVTGIWISDFAAKGTLLPLDPFFDKWSDKDKITKSLVDYNRTLVPDKKLYQIPSTMYLDVFWYRSDLIKNAGLKPPTTWNDFFIDAEKLTDASKNQYGYTIRGGSGSINQLTTVMYAYSGLEHYFDAKGKATVNDPKNLEFLKKYVGMYKKYTPTSDITNAYKEMVATFDTGTSAMVQHNFGSYNNHFQALGEGKFASTILPKSDNGKTIVAPTANGYGIFKNSKHPEEAWEFFKYMLSSESQAYWNEKIGQMPINVDALQSDYVKKSQHIQDGANVMADKNTVVLDVPSYLPDYSSILAQTLEPNFQKVMSGTMTAEAFLDGWASAMEKAKMEYDKGIKK
ncbi:ABC transporter substrate-binding protein [Paenibacillus aceris]|uniref:Multiple sugar transport system substrate-binding protein n=1 Tax=Paenibacillus aceris TaxID=869555 RepID=A0ABS4HX65_9BACL|nr:sugar ABC transporter substrate-binding protein [Paenibacillus aceris]MBP1963247.1 multiple sugar transport system substrate-binding protein [Paenibacillus aceris]NHW38640.1 sugar ABC transporter substrate-binding protein [Paenibacillus aceris]